MNVSMDKEDSDRIQELCGLIAVEHDRQKFLAFVEELNRILSVHERRLEKGGPTKD